MTRLVFALFAVVFGALLPLDARTQENGSQTPPIEVEVVGLRSDNGKVSCSIFNSPDGFPRHGKVLREVWAPIKDRRAVCSFIGFPPGSYAVVVYHDENGNGKFDFNMLGIPKEGYGFSNDAKPHMMTAPTFQAASFSYPGKATRLLVHMSYWL